MTLLLKIILEIPLTIYAVFSFFSLLLSLLSEGIVYFFLKMSFFQNRDKKISHSSEHFFMLADQFSIDHNFTKHYEIFSRYRKEAFGTL